MPHTGRYTVCPFYKNHHRKTISCEDAFHRFETVKERGEWMDRYCDLDWKKCIYADEMLNAYQRMYKGDVMATEEQRIKSLERENRNLSAAIGRAEKRLKEKDEEIRDLKHSFIEEQQKANEFADRLFATAHMYEARFCFLMTKYADGTFDETEFQEWNSGKEFRLEAAEKDQDGNIIFWRANVREAQDEETETTEQVRQQED